MSLNVVNLVGRAGKDPERRDLYVDGTSYVVCKIPMAVSRLSRNSDEPDWFDLELWNKAAEIAASYVRKGSLIGITGSLRFDHWQDRATGTPRCKPIISVTKLDLLGSKRDNENAGGGDQPFVPPNYDDY